MILYVCPFLFQADASFTVIGSSMSPSLRSGDTIYVQKDVEINIDDVIVVIRGESRYVHRVVRVTGNSDLAYQTKGDANEDPDVEWVKKSDIIGKVTSSLPTWWMITPHAFVVFTLIPFGFLIYKQFSIIKKLLESEESNIELLDTTSLLLIGIVITGCIRIIMLVWG